MVFLGYMRWDGVEIANDLRSSTYSKNLGLPFGGFTWCDDLLDNLAFREWNTVDPTVGYQTVADSAPWYDEHNPSSSEFIGMQILDIANIQNSTRQLTVAEDAGGGGTVNGERRSPREYVVRAILMSSTDRGLDYGLAWLTTTLEYGDTCDVAVNPQRLISGAVRVDYLNTCPTEGGSPWRHLLDVWSLQPPVVLRRHTQGRDCEGASWMEIEFTATALNPGVWHDVIDFKNAGVGIDYSFINSVDGWEFYRDEASVADNNDVYQANLFYEFAANTYSNFKSSVLRQATLPAGAGASIPLIQQAPVVDPACPLVPGFPEPPQAVVRCRPEYTGAWESYIFAFRDDVIPHHVPLAPVFQIRTGDTPLEQVRITLNTGQLGDLYQLEVSYIPPDSLMKICSRQRRADVYTETSPGSGEYEWKPAGHLVYTLGGKETFQYQELFCPSGIVMTIDYPTELPNAYPYPAKNVTLWLGPRDS